MPLNGYRFIDSSKVKLGQVIWKEGESLQYTYDLGDNFIHNLTVEKVIVDGDGSVELLDGRMACPPEDSNGFDGAGSCGYVEMLSNWATMSKTERKRIKAGVLTATNYKNKTTFNPWVFDIEEAKGRLAEALSSRQSVCVCARLLYVSKPNRFLEERSFSISGCLRRAIALLTCVR
jgi:hypothetical protein